jgi:hypothetical protein
MSFPPLFQPFHEVDVVEVFGVGWFETDHWTSGLSLRPAILRPTFSAGVSEVSRLEAAGIQGIRESFPLRKSARGLSVRNDEFRLTRSLWR